MATVTGTVNVNAISHKGLHLNNTSTRIPEDITLGEFKGGVVINSGTTNITLEYADGSEQILPAGLTENFSSDNGQLHQPLNVNATGGTAEITYYL